MNKRETAFVKTVLDYYRRFGRHDLPWRQTTDPYHILVSEIMLQQTQVERVITKYQAFIARWPTVQTLADASLKDILVAWQGLGYNRRARFLHLCAQTVVREYGGVFPRTVAALNRLPGIGAYTAGAIMAFAYNSGVPLIETNVRTVFIHHFFARRETVTDQEILRLVEKTLPRDNPRAWYAALMDYGTYLKRTVPPVHRKSRTYKKQTAFKGSLRAVRGAVLRLLTATTYSTIPKLIEATGETRERVVEALEGLKGDGLIRVSGSRVQIC
jgi:A/G-specific adenine glycosylase